MEFPTPTTSHLTSHDFERIYEPAEDSYLLMDALEAHCQQIRNLRPSLCVEVGVGSGAVLTFLGGIIGSSAHYIGTDISRHAAVAARSTGQHNNILIDTVQTDLVTALLPRCSGCVDVMLFNPPYVVTPSEEISQGGIAATWAGGVNGREVTDRLLPLVSRLLSPSGRFYLLLLEENQPGDVHQILSDTGLSGEEVIRRRSGPENLSVWCYKRK
ncbi:methyltransferase N6AMT1-like isoform X2 [Sycon ciliatum]|uniref:methyltransferase N6AMT1-like isoform X2 n=1 Tax=Sycon ciliatum TaxID=27933 RepID=UPI0020AD6397|eukprot:scpid69305/ scgid5415/ HemK methyltransferase family member 2; M.HsaHemK2P; N(6)-adenine-specific DNA methyltransferase 1